MLGVIDLPPLGSPEELRLFRILVEHFMLYPTGGLLRTCGLRAIWYYYGNGSIETLTSDLSTKGSFFVFLQSPTASFSPSLDSAAFVSFPDTVGNPEDVLPIFFVVQCGHQLCPELTSLTPNTTRLDWSFPVQRHWLCRTRIGDIKDGQGIFEEVTQDRWFFQSPYFVTYRSLG